MSLISIRVLIVDDSILFRTKLQLSLSKDPNIEIVGCASDGAEALKLVDTLKPEVISVDVEMPGVNGIEFLRLLSRKKPIPAILVSSLDLTTHDARNFGAAYFIKKPQLGNPNSVSDFIDELSKKIKLSSKFKPTADSANPVKKSVANVASGPKLGGKDSLIAIGASTGGTDAIIDVVRDLPANSPPVVIVQHMPAMFTSLYADRLDKICKMSVKEAKDLDRISTGQIILAAGEYHMTLKKDANGYFIRSAKGSKVSGHCPSVDVLFDSVADTCGRNALGVILTGMGSDGACGITKMRKLGAYTIGQDKETSVVYGMPMEAFKLGGVAKQLPLNKITEGIVGYFSKNIR